MVKAIFIKKKSFYFIHPVILHPFAAVTGFTAACLEAHFEE